MKMTMVSMFRNAGLYSVVSCLVFTSMDFSPWRALALTSTTRIHANLKHSSWRDEYSSVGMSMATITNEGEDQNSNGIAADREAEENLSNFNFQKRLILSRRTINEFEKDLPEGWEDSLERAIEAATFAPNHKRTEPWRFHLLGPKSIENVCKLNAELVSVKKGKQAGEKKLKRWLDMPGWLVVTCVKSDNGNKSRTDNNCKPSEDTGIKNRMKRWVTAPLRLFSSGKDNAKAEKDVVSSMDDPSGVAREDYAACCCAVQNLCLSLHADGMGTKWTTGPVNFDSRFASAVGMPSNEYVVGTIWFGKPSYIPKAPKKKFSVADVLTKQD